VGTGKADRPAVGPNYPSPRAPATREGPSSGRLPGPMKTNIRKSKAKHAKKTGYRTRQRTAGGRKVNRRQRARHGSF